MLGRSMREGGKPDAASAGPSLWRSPQVLIVCTANRARSAMAECMLRARLPKAAAEVASAGTSALEGASMTSSAIEVMSELGLDCSTFRAAALTPNMVQSAALVLTATRDHRAHAVGLVPSATRRAFTMMEFARLVEITNVGALHRNGRLEDLVADVARSRGTVVVPEDEDDIIDPVGQPKHVYRACRESIRVCVDGIAPVLEGLLSTTTETADQARQGKT